MPIVYIHGVNVRTSPVYAADVAARDELLKRLLIKPLANKVPAAAGMQIVNPYWGNHGVTFHWNLATLPVDQSLEAMGGVEAAGAGETPQADQELAALVEAAGAAPAPGLEGMGGGETPYKLAAQADLARFLEAVLSPIIYDEQSLTAGADDAPEVVGRREALLLIAGQDVAHDPAVRQAVADAPSDDALMALLAAAVQKRYQELLLDSELVSPAERAAMAGGLEALGGPAWFQQLTGQVGDLFDRAKNAPGRAATLAVADRLRPALHRKMGQFFGDVFVYLKERGSAAQPGPIVQTVLAAIATAPRARPDEPLIVITHSMGGNVLYDLLTSFAPELKVDAWVSAGGQVGQFEEMKLFVASDPTVKAPNKVTGLGPRLGFWLNVYDPADPLSFRAEPVFAGAHDVAFNTGESVFKAHNEYFKRPSFYALVLGRLAGALP